MNCVRTVTALCATLLLCACEHKELCLHTWLDHNKAAKVRVDVDWSNFDAEEPTGMTLSFFNTALEKQFSESTNDIYSYTTQLPAGTYNINVVNQSPDELYTVDFIGFDSGTNLAIVGTNTSMPTFVLQDFRESVNTEPQDMAYDMVYDIVVPENATETIVVKMVAKPVLYTADISIEVKGYSKIARVYGVLSGIADGYNAISMLPTQQTSSFEISDWSIAPLNSDSGLGLLTASARIFGVSPTATYAERNIYLKVYMLLKDGKTFCTETFPVNDCFIQDNNRHYSIYIAQPIELPDINYVDPSTGSGGAFDADVSEWGEEIQIEFK